MSERIVYFIRPKGQDGPVKIGCSSSPRSRLLMLAVWCPYELEVAATAVGGFDMERRCHLKFGRLRLHHEWFAAAPELTAFVEHVATHGVLPDLPSLPLPKTKPPKHSLPLQSQMKSKATRLLNRAMVHVYGRFDKPPFPSHIQAIRARYRVADNPPPTLQEWEIINAFCAQMHGRHQAPCWYARQREWLIYRRDHTPEAPLSAYNLNKLSKYEAAA